MGRTDHHTGWLELQLHPVGTEVALGCRMGLGIDVDGLIGTGLHAGLAADAGISIEFYDAIGSLNHGRDWADGHAGWILTMIAAAHLEVATSVWIGTAFGDLDPGAMNAQGNLVLTFAGY